jgi:hypothetical protein
VTTNRTIAPYSGVRLPLKVNAFEAAKAACSQLLPMFPYVGPDAIVPAIGVSLQEESVYMGRFFHQNSVDEVGMCIGAAGSGGRPGAVWSTGRTHPVGRTDDEPEPEAGSAGVITVIQRHGTVEQNETFIIRCSACQHLLLRHSYAFTPTTPADDGLETFETLIECANGADTFNSEPARRKCGKCGHENAPFPLDRWGWSSYRSNSAAAEASRRALVEAASAVTDGPAQ